MTPAHRVLGAIDWLLRGLSGPPMKRVGPMMAWGVIGVAVVLVGYWFGWWR